MFFTGGKCSIVGGPPDSLSEGVALDELAKCSGVVAGNPMGDAVTWNLYCRLDAYALEPRQLGCCVERKARDVAK